MPTWRCNPAGVRSVVETTARAAPHGTAYPDSLDSAVAALGGASDVIAAVHQFADVRGDLSRRLERRISAVVGAAATVTEAFVVGDAEMSDQVTAAQLSSTTAEFTDRGVFGAQ